MIFLDAQWEYTFVFFSSFFSSAQNGPNSVSLSSFYWLENYLCLFLFSFYDVVANNLNNANKGWESNILTHLFRKG